MPANEDGLQQTTLWTLEDDFEGRSTPGADRPQRANGHDQASIPVALDAAAVREERNEQPPGELGFDGHTYTYTGYVLEEGRYVRRQARFTPDEIAAQAIEAAEAGALYGLPDEIIAKLQALQDVGAEYLLLNAAGGIQSLRRFAKEVMPTFSHQAALKAID